MFVLFKIELFGIVFWEFTEKKQSRINLYNHLSILHANFSFNTKSITGGGG